MTENTPPQSPLDWGEEDLDSRLRGNDIEGARNDVEKAVP